MCAPSFSSRSSRRSSPPRGCSQVSFCQVSRIRPRTSLLRFASRCRSHRAVDVFYVKDIGTDGKISGAGPLPTTRYLAPWSHGGSGAQRRVRVCAGALLLLRLAGVSAPEAPGARWGQSVCSQERRKGPARAAPPSGSPRLLRTGRSPEPMPAPPPAGRPLGPPKWDLFAPQLLTPQPRAVAPRALNRRRVEDFAPHGDPRAPLRRGPRAHAAG